ncbi:hypothetical protein SVIOM342S_01653 [Streptomyces violaceorubidus]
MDEPHQVVGPVGVQQVHQDPPRRWPRVHRARQDHAEAAMPARPSAWIEIAASAFASLPIRRPLLHTGSVRTVAVLRQLHGRALFLKQGAQPVGHVEGDFASGQPALVAVPVASHSSRCVPMSTLRSISDACRKLAGLWPGSMTTTSPLRAPEAGAGRRRGRLLGRGGEGARGLLGVAALGRGRHWRRAPPTSVRRPPGRRRRRPRRPGRRPPRTPPTRSAPRARARRPPRSAGGAAGSGGAGEVRSPGLCTTRQRL